MSLGLTAAVVSNLLLLLFVLARPAEVESARGKTLLVLVFAVLPLSLVGAGGVSHLERSKSTSFCLSCHEMEPYGRSLHVDRPGWLVANHYQNKTVPSERACYACHTQYTMYGGFEAKIKGLQHVWVHYLGEPPETIALYEPFQNRECLRCHAGARSFEDNEFHRDIAEELAEESTSCLECHEPAHEVEALDDLPAWRVAS